MICLALLLLAAPVDHDVLLQLLQVDTSHGHETQALEPVLQRFKAAGVPAQILESAPGRGNLVARVKGTGAKKPLLLVAHIDVVPVEGQPWKTPPFTPTGQDGFLYARGVSDDKAMAAAIVDVALELAASPQKPARDVVVALTAGEETGGFAGVKWLVDHHRDLIEAELALNEGGGITLAPDLSRVQSLDLAVAEKTFQSLRLTAHGPGGHSSVPPTDKDPSLELARAVVKIGEFRFPAHVLPEVRGKLLQLSHGEKPPLSDALARAAQGTLSAQDEQVISKERIYNAMIRTTCVTTQLQGSPQDNVLPTSAQAVVNCRILPDETIEQTKARQREVNGDPGIDLAETEPFGPGGKVPAEGAVPSAVRAAAQRVFGNAPVVETLQLGATDSRYLREIGILAYGIHTAPGTLDDVRKGMGAHGANERRPVRWLPEGTKFLREVVRELVK
ncbi:MAG TPA: M20/M25/M40 family metallo-hydrolase [Myxococcales bacterium]